MRKRLNSQQGSRDESQHTLLDEDSSETKESLDVPPSFSHLPKLYKPSKPGAVSLEERAIAPVCTFLVILDVKNDYSKNLYIWNIFGLAGYNTIAQVNSLQLVTSQMSMSLLHDLSPNSTQIIHPT